MTDEIYNIGYGKPPKHTQFKKGKSGNRFGCRLRMPLLDPKTILERELGKKITIQENGRKKRTTTMHALFKSLLARAFKGDRYAIEKIFKYLEAGRLDFPEVREVTQARMELRKALIEDARKLAVQHGMSKSEIRDIGEDD